MKIEAQPPTVLQAGVAMEWPLVVSTDAPKDIFHAVLVDPSGKVLESHLMSGPVTTPKIRDAEYDNSSAKPPTRVDFSNITISCPGRYKIRVDVYMVGFEQATRQSCVESHIFTVQEHPVDKRTSSKSHLMPKYITHANSLSLSEA